MAATSESPEQQEDNVIRDSIADDVFKRLPGGHGDFDTYIQPAG